MTLTEDLTYSTILSCTENFDPNKDELIKRFSVDGLASDILKEY